MRVHATRLGTSALIVALLFGALTLCAQAQNVVPQAALQGGLTSSRALLPIKCVADSDGITCHLVVDVASGSITGTFSTTFPYAGTSDAQTATASSFVGVAGIDPNGTVTRFHTTADGALYVVPTALPTLNAHIVDVLPTPIAYPTDAAGVPYVHATSLPTINAHIVDTLPTPIAWSTGNPEPVNMVNSPSFSISSLPSVTISPLPVPENPVAETGGGFTHVAAAAIATSAPQPIQTSAATLAGVMVTWAAPTTNTTCWVTLYDSLAAPTVGTAFLYPPVPITTSVPGAFALPVPPTIGVKIVNGLWIAVSTTPTGSTACNTTAGQLWFSADLK